MAATIESVAGFVGLSTLRALFPVADEHYASQRHALLTHIVDDSSGATVTQSQIVFAGSTFITVAFDDDAPGGEFLEQGPKGPRIFV